jgi:adenylyl-sulfate kinase
MSWSAVTANGFDSASISGGTLPDIMTNIHPETRRFLDREAKERLLGQRGIVLWLFGLSGSGKSTIANEVERTLHAEGRMTVILDGDNLRAGLNRNLGFTDDDRTENVRRVAETAKLLAGQGIITLVSVIAPFRSHRALAAEIIGADFHEIYVQAEFATCAARDPKGLYAKAKDGQIGHFTGRDSLFEEPERPSLVLDTPSRSVEQCAADLLGYLRSVGVASK